jgi:hypothetical protein
MKFIKFICLSCVLVFSTASYSEDIQFGTPRFMEWAALLLQVDRANPNPVYVYQDGSINYPTLYADTPAFAAFITAVSRAQRVDATLNWNIPSKRTDGSSLISSDLSRYEIYMTAGNTGESKTIRIENVGQTSYEFKGLQAGKYYFAMASVDKQGRTSPLSAVISKTVVD